MSQAALDGLVDDLNRLRSESIVPRLRAGLNEQQTEALLHGDGPCLVLAGAGSGKTTVLTRRVARLISDGTDPERIFVATFTKKAAEEMSARLADVLGDGGRALVERLWIGTFHSHCLRILKTEWALLRGKAGFFQIADEHWQKRVARGILGDKQWLPGSAPTPPFGMNIGYDFTAALTAVSAAKNRGYAVDEAERAFRDHDGPISDAVVAKLAKFWRCYEQAKEERFDVLSKKPSRRLDFDDLLIETLRLLRTEMAVLSKYRSRFDAILVDETQDTSAVQWEIARLIAGDGGAVFIVGDVGQAIYSFRGADPRATITQFTGAYPSGRIIRLPVNYRSSATIVRAANDLIRGASIADKYRLEMSPSRGDGLDLEASEHETADCEAAWIAESLGRHRADGRALRDCAVLFRTNAYSRALEESFVQNGIPYRLEGALGFYGRREIRDLLAFLHLSVERTSPAADEACKRILNIPSKSFGKPTRFLGGSFVAMVEAGATARGIPFYKALVDGQFKTAQGLAVRDFRDGIRQVSEAGDAAEARLRKARSLGYDDFLLREEGLIEPGEGNSRLDNLEELCAASAAFPSATAYLDFVLAQQRRVGEEPVGDALEMMTIHRAKGLEWPIVYVAGFAYGMIPHHRSLRYFDDDKQQLIPESIDEERRLAYVAITRAKEQVYLTWPTQHQSRLLFRSPFLAEMPSLAIMPANSPSLDTQPPASPSPETRE